MKFLIVSIFSLLSGHFAVAAILPQKIFCHIEYADMIRDISPSAPLTKDNQYLLSREKPSEVSGLSIMQMGYYFKIQTQFLAPDHLQVSVYDDTQSNPLLIHQSKYHIQKIKSEYGFTGKQTIFEKDNEAELRYWCQYDQKTVLNPNPLFTTQKIKCSKSNPEKIVTLNFLGDLMLTDGPGKYIAEGGDPLLPFDSVFKSADFSIGNLETSVSLKGEAKPDKKYTFRSHPNVMKILQNRLTAVSLANNHSGDFGHEALLDTIKYVKESGLQYFGGGANLTEAHQPLWLEKNGIKIALLGYNDFKPRSFGAGPTWPGIAWFDIDQVVSEIRQAKKNGADIVIPYLHWGWEYEPSPSIQQRHWAKKMLDAGASAIIGGHPHVTQGGNIYKGKPIIWSLGNFVFDGFDEGPGRHGWLVQLTISKDEVISLKTLSAHMNDQGIPRHESVQTPCWNKCEKQISLCQGL